MIRCRFRAAAVGQVELDLGEDGSIECAVRWLRDDRIGLEFAHETQIDCAPKQRAALLLDVIRAQLPEQESTFDGAEPVQARGRGR